MLDSGESQKEAIRPDFNRTIVIDFQGAQITSKACDQAFDSTAAEELT